MGDPYMSPNASAVAPSPLKRSTLFMLASFPTTHRFSFQGPQRQRPPFEQSEYPSVFTRAGEFESNVAGSVRADRVGRNVFNLDGEMGRIDTKVQPQNNFAYSPSYARSLQIELGRRNQIFSIVLASMVMGDLHTRIATKARLEAERVKRIGADAAAKIPPPSTRRGDVDRIRDTRVAHRIAEGRDDREAFLCFTRANRDQQNE